MPSIMNFETAVQAIKRETSNGIPVLPYVRKYGKLIKPPIKKERSLSPRPEEEAQRDRSICPQELRIQLTRTTTTPTFKHPIIKTEKGSPASRERKAINGVCKRELVIRLKRIKSYSKSNLGGSTLVEDEASILRRKPVVLLTRVDEGSLPGETLDTRRRVKAELREDHVNEGKEKVRKILKLRLKRIDDNILFHIKINNPEAVNRRRGTTPAISEVVPPPLSRSPYIPGKEQLFAAKLERHQDAALGANWDSAQPPPKRTPIHKVIKTEMDFSTISAAAVVEPKRRGRPPKFPKRKVGRPKKIVRAPYKRYKRHFGMDKNKS